ncbi:flexible cuticle protein 12-like [Penaeus vannamei]|uniref:flexible cuticle protein 12-like n=2 Tax=Penaeus vannamei TaxID=6689 RepID=UPI00387F9065
MHSMQSLEGQDASQTFSNERSRLDSSLLRHRIALHRFLAVLTMQRLLILACLVAVVVADSYKTPIPILKDDRTQNAYGEYTFDFETGNGIARNEAGNQADGQESSGGWSYTAPEGVPIKLSFTSGVGGYQPVGDHLPVAPTPVPLPYERQDY